MLLKQDTGIDISDYQPNLQLAALSPLPRFVIAKATESLTFRCTTTKDFAAQSKALGIPYGFYHFWQNTDPYKQANNYIEQVNLAGGFERIPPVLDLEVSNLGTYGTQIKTWLDIVEDAAGKRPILYSNKSHFDMIAGYNWFKDYDVWTAAYPANPDLWSWCPPLYSEKRARREVMWQYGSTYRYPNYSANSVDTNIAITEFLNEIGAVTPPPPPIGGTMLYGKINTGALNVRTGPGSSNSLLGTVIKDDYVMATEVAGGWWHLTEAYRGSWTGVPVALNNGTLINDHPSAWCSGAYILTVDAPPVVPPPPVTVYPDLPVSITLGDDVTFIKQTVNVILKPK